MLLTLQDGTPPERQGPARDVRKGDPVNRISSVLYALAALGFLFLLWQALPPGGFEGDAWGTGIRLRLVGFAALILLMGYFLLSRLGRK